MFHIRLHSLCKEKNVCVLQEPDSDGKRWGQAKGRGKRTGKWAERTSIFPVSAASVAGTSHNSQDVEENVDDVGVEVEGGKDVLLRAQRQLLVAQEELSVNSQKLQRKKIPLIPFIFGWINDLILGFNVEGNLRRWRAVPPGRRRQCPGSCDGWRCRGWRRGAGRSDTQTGRPGRRWSRTCSAIKGTRRTWWRFRSKKCVDRLF